MQKGYKYDSVDRMLQTWPWIYDYTYIWLCDDDIMTSWSNIQRMFDLMEEYSLDLAQPALSKDSYSMHDICCVRPEYILRYTNFVEVMVPVLSSATLRKCQQTMKLSPSGIQIDWIWPKLLGNPRHSIAILDDVPVHHTRECGTSTMWDKIRAEGDELQQQLKADMRRYGVEPTQCIYKEYGHILKTPAIALPQMRTFIAPRGQQLSQRLAPLLGAAVAHPIPQEWKRNPVWQSDCPWDGGTPQDAAIPLISNRNWCLSLGLSFNLDAVSAEHISKKEKTYLFYIGDTPEKIPFGLWLSPSDHEPEESYSLISLTMGPPKFENNLKFPHMQYGRTYHLSIQIYPPAGWICHWLDYTPLKDMWTDPFRTYPASKIHFGHEALHGSIRDFWLSPTPATEQKEG